MSGLLARSRHRDWRITVTGSESLSLAVIRRRDLETDGHGPRRSSDQSAAPGPGQWAAVSHGLTVRLGEPPGSKLLHAGARPSLPSWQPECRVSGTCDRDRPACLAVSHGEQPAMMSASGPTGPPGPSILHCGTMPGSRRRLRLAALQGRAQSAAAPQQARDSDQALELASLTKHMQNILPVSACAQRQEQHNFRSLSL